MPRVDRLRRPRRFDAHALVALAPIVALVPGWFVATAAIWWVVQLFRPVPFPLFALLFLSCGGLLFLRPVQRLVLQRLLGARTPTRGEADVLRRAWREVAQANHIPPGRLVLAVIDSDELNAFASGGHLVVVSSFAVQNLSHDELVGVLAHELCHHLGMHTVALTISQWLSLPIVLLAKVGFALRNVADAATHSVARDAPGGVALARVTSGVLRAVGWLLMSMITLSQYIANFVGKGAEFKADEMVVDMGFGRGLRNALRIVRDEGHSDRPTKWQDRLHMGHPPATTRIARIEARLRRPPGERLTANRPR